MPDLTYGAWSAQSQPHAKSTRLSRFRPDVRTSVGPDMPLATVIYQARCEIADEPSCLPINMAISSGGSCTAITSAGGWKNRDPVVQFFLLDEADNDGLMPEGRTFDPRLSDVARHVVLEENRKLIFVADDHRVKSFSWNTSDRTTPQAVHTLWSEMHTGPLALLPQDRIARAGNGEAFVWNINDLETHGSSKRRIGKGKFNVEDASRENEDGEIELSTGSRPHHTVKFAEKDFAPCSWHLHMPTNRLIASHGSTMQDPRYGCIAIDLEDGGKTAARYLGHGGQVEGLSTSTGDPNLFATAASDGFARLYDVRHPLPVLTFDTGALSEFCADVVFVHPDGLPSMSYQFAMLTLFTDSYVHAALFTGGRATQQIKMWDVRARCVVYELATGNNDVSALAWDSGRSTLWAATECLYIDRMGYNHDYRRAKAPGHLSWGDRHEGDGDDEEEDDYDEEDDALEGDEKLWPQRAFHREDYFGYMFDAGNHRVCEFARLISTRYNSPI